MEDISQEITKLSKINSAALINLRISNLWQNINRYAATGQYFRWNSELDRVWCELVGDVEPTKKNKKKTEGEEEKKGDEEIFEGFNIKIALSLKKLKTKTGFSEHTKEDKEIMFEIYQAIQKKEVFLRRLMNSQGKGTAYQEEADWD